MAGRPRTRSGSYNVGPRQRAAGYRRRRQRMVDEWAVASSPEQQLAVGIRAMSAIAALPAPSSAAEAQRNQVVEEAATHLRRGVELLCSFYEKEVQPK